MAQEIIDADGHVTETWEQIARHLEEPHRKRSLLTPFWPQDAWPRPGPLRLGFSRTTRRGSTA
jgi:hypothetical protein